MKYLKKRTKKNKKLKKNTKKYRCVKLTSRNKKYKGGASTQGLPMIIDQNNIAYSCTPVPTK